MNQFSYKYFFITFTLAVVLVILVGFASLFIAIKLSDTSTLQNQFILSHQLEKLTNEESVEILIVGDSSAGHAIDAEYFSELSGKKTINLALTGSFGLAGGYNMIRHALEREHPIDTVIIIHTLDIWQRPFSTQGYFSSLHGLPQDSLASLAIKNPSLNFIQSSTHFDSFLKYVPLGKEVVIEEDFLTQKKERFSNEQKILGENAEIFESLNEDKLKVLRETDALCAQNNLNCVLLSGPIHEELAHKSRDAISHIKGRLKAKNLSLMVRSTLFDHPSEEMGDSIDHIDPAFKKVSTLRYFTDIDMLFE